MNIIITGATGFIGTNLIRLISEKLPEVVILAPCRNLEKAATQFKDYECQISLVKSDDWKSITEFAPEVVIHLAALSTSRNDFDTIEHLVDSNITYGVKLLSSIGSCDSLKLFVNVGSFSEYLRSVREIDDAYLYSATKSAFRYFVKYYADLCGFKYITAVPYSVYGGVSKVKRVFDYMLEASNSAEPVPMSDGHQVLDFIHVDDVCDFFLTVLNDLIKFSSLEQGKEFHLGTGSGHSLRDTAGIIETLSKSRLNIDWGALPYRARDTMCSVAPIMLNDGLWVSKISISAGIAMFMNEKNKNEL